MTPAPAPTTPPRTTAQRKAAQRARDRRAVIDAIGAESGAGLRTLCELLRSELLRPEPGRSAWRAWCELGRRMQWIDGSDRVIDPADPVDA